MDETPDRLPGVDPELLSGADDETLRAQVTELERVAAAASDATLVVDESGVVQSADEGVESLLGYEPDTVVG
jgi:PAS domain-containing protein